MIPVITGKNINIDDNFIIAFIDVRGYLYDAKNNN